MTLLLVFDILVYSITVILIFKCTMCMAFENIGVHVMFLDFICIIFSYKWNAICGALCLFGIQFPWFSITLSFEQAIRYDSLV